jgi:hypothetical protein
VTAEFRQALGRIESLIAALEELPDTAAREAARCLVQAVLDLHSLGLKRILELAGDSADRLADDSLAGALLLLHKLHPQPPLERLRRLFDCMRPRFHALGGEVEAVSATEGQARIRLDCSPETASALRAETAELVLQALPDVASVEYEEVWDVAGAGRLSLPLVRSGAGRVP